jgi:hypothetical protein
MAQVGRPPKLTDEQRVEVYEALEEFIRVTDDPTIPWFVSYDDVAMKYNVTRDNLNDWDEFSTLIKKAVIKQEAFILKNAGNNKYNPTIGIFRLKQPQHGYSDRTQTDLTSNGETLAPLLVKFMDDNKDS